MTHKNSTDVLTPRGGIVHEGHTFDKPLIGMTLPEHNLGPCAVHDDAPHHAICGVTRSGKNVTAGIHQLLGVPSDTDVVVLSEKCDLVNTVMGRFVDQRIFENPEWVRRYGSRLGVDTRGITNISFWRPFARGMNFDAGFQSAFAPTPYTYLCDVDPNKAGAWERLHALSRGIITEDRNSKTDRWWIEKPQSAISGVCGHVLTSKSERYHNLVVGAQLLLGVDPRTGQASPANHDKLFKEMMRNPAMGGKIAEEGLSLYELAASPRSFAPLMNTIGTKLGWLLTDERLKRLISGPSAFRLGELGCGEHSLAIFVQPPRGGKSTKAIQRMFFELLLTELQQRPGPSKRKIMLFLDELPQYGTESLQLVVDMLNVLGDLNVTVVIVFQSIGQLIDLTSEATVAAMLSACAVQVLGCRDEKTAQWINRRLGKTQIVRDGKLQEVDVVSEETIYQELAPDSPLQYYFPYRGGKAMKLYRPAMKDMTTGVGLVVKGLNWQGHYDEGLPPYVSRGKG